MMLAGAVAVVARAQPPGKGGKISLSKIDKSSFFETYIYCMHSGSIGHLQLTECRLRTQILRGFIKKFEQTKCIPRT